MGFQNFEKDSDENFELDDIRTLPKNIFRRPFIKTDMTGRKILSPEISTFHTSFFSPRRFFFLNHHPRHRGLFVRITATERSFRGVPPPSRYRLISVQNSDATKRSELNGTERSSHERTCITFCKANTHGCSAKQEMRNVFPSRDISFCGCQPPFSFCSECLQGLN
ncbi:hypothetical protein CEXT_476001 [Caerostris extrusa]|uniref:Uncharacterized protein n=1 Tax=Caerostris extrusa TaxID=172846 RepID=A0AAV4U1V5_CAEEX|nr:hypothetical protein CEXT_476001 [Caerostris extrusa]